MYWTPWARLMRSITPNTSVSPAAIRNSSTPSCSPLRICTKRRVDIRSLFGCRIRNRTPHRAVLRVDVLVIAEHLLGDLGLELAVLALRRLHQIEVLDRIVIVAELEIAAQRLEVRFLERGAHGVLVGKVAFDGGNRA